MKPRILVLYYTQTGQLQRILESIVAGMGGKADVDAVEIEAQDPFPFPWTTRSFFGLLPDCMEHREVAVKPLAIPDKEYDLIILGYQPWFLNPSLPFISFLKSDQALRLKDKPVVTVTGCRKMWVHAQETMKEYLAGHNCRLVGHIVLNDRMPAPVSSLTSARWLFKGKKEASDILPDGGVSYNDIFEAQRFGAPICKHLADDNLIDLHRALLALGAVHLTSAGIIAERYKLRIFRYGAGYIAGADDAKRMKRIKKFKNVLFTVLYALAGIFVHYINKTACAKPRTIKRQGIFPAVKV